MKTKKIDHEALDLHFEIPDSGLRQRHIEEFYKALGERSSVRGMLGPVRNGHIVRAAITVGWLEGQLTDEEVGDMHPAGVTWLASELDDIVAAAFVIEGE